MKIAIVGCGALGSYYGAKLCRDGHETHFLLRSDYEVVRRQGVEIRSADGNFHVQPHCAQAPEEIGLAELVLIGLKTTANAQFKNLLPPLIGRNTAVITFQNGLGNEAAVAAIVGAEKTLGGLCYVALNRIAPGTILHLGLGLIVLGEYQRPIQERTRHIEKAFNHAGVPCRLTENLEQSRWEKLIWNIPFNGLGVASAFGYEALESRTGVLACSGQGGPSAFGHEALEGRTGVLACSGQEGPSASSCETSVGYPISLASRQNCLATDELLADPNWKQMALGLMDELVVAGNTLGYSLPSSIPDKMIARTLELGHYKASTVIDFELGKPLELEALFMEPLRQSERSGVAVPRLKALCRVLAGNC